VLFNEPKLLKSSAVLCTPPPYESFSALQRAEIAEMFFGVASPVLGFVVSVLFNEPKLLKCCGCGLPRCSTNRFSALQRAEIAEIVSAVRYNHARFSFQCSSTSRNC